MSQTIFSNLILWSEKNYSHLPWRKERTLYRTLVSEIMLQQTTVSTVLNRFEKFLKTYPTIFSLAQASEEEVCISWKGLGYYRRARSLRSLAIQIVEEWQGEIPTEEKNLLKFKGIGLYTAHAIIAIGANKKGLAVDANLERVLARFYGIKMEKGPKLQKKLWADFYDQKILSEINKVGARKLNEALMDLGRVHCQTSRVNCSLCELSSACVAHQEKKELNYPIVANKKGKRFFIKALRVIVREKNKILVYKKKSHEWLAGQWEVPTFVLETDDEKLLQYPHLVLRNKTTKEELPSFKTTITKYTILNLVMELNLDEFRKLIKKKNVIYQFRIHGLKLNLSTASSKAFLALDKNREKE